MMRCRDCRRYDCECITEADAVEIRQQLRDIVERAQDLSESLDKGVVDTDDLIGFIDHIAKEKI